MPLGSKIKSVLLRLPCGHGGSKFEKDEPGVISPRVRAPPTRTGPSESVVASAPIVAPRTGGARDSRENNLIPRGTGVGTEEGSGIGISGTAATGTAEVGELMEREGREQELHQALASSPEKDQDPDIRDSGYEPGPSEPAHPNTIFNNPQHPDTTAYEGYPATASKSLDQGPLSTYEQTSNPAKTSIESPVDRSLPLRNELGRNSSEDSQSSDYSNHSITQSLNPNSRPTSRVYYGQRYDGDLREARKQRFPPRIAVESSGSIGLPTAFETTSDRGPSRSLPRPPLGVVPSFICPRGEVGAGLSTGSPGRENNEFASTYSGTGAGEKGEKKEDMDVHSRSGAREITLEEEQRYRSPGQQFAADTTSIHQEILDPVIHTIVRPVENEERTTVITRENHHTEIHPIVQPIVDIQRLPQKHYLETPDGKLVEITAEEAERQGWDEIWNGDLIPDNRNESGFKVRDAGEAKDEGAEREIAALELESRNRATPHILNTSNVREEGVCEPYGNGDITSDNV